jgi:hypothetical protein
MAASSSGDASQILPGQKPMVGSHVIAQGLDQRVVLARRRAVGHPRRTSGYQRGKDATTRDAEHVRDHLKHGVVLSVSAPWLGHESAESTEGYLHADMRFKERALPDATAAGITPRRFRAPDRLLAFLETL